MPTPRRRVPVRAGEPARSAPPLLLAAVSGALVVAIHVEVFPYPLEQYLRDWLLHFAALVAATVFTAAVLGHRRAARDGHSQRVLRIACAVPLAITLLHELGQWLWPAGARDAFDSVRDAMLNVAGTVIGWWALRSPRHGPQA